VNVEEFSRAFQETVDEVSRVLLGQREVIEHVLVAMLSRGHVLIEGVPGLGKTLLVRALGHVLGCTFRRIQFTPDLMPSDVTGNNVYNTKAGEFEFVPGPVFTQLLLADEINRAPAKTQAALLEAMQERSVTIDGTTRRLPEPFLVLATQNPIDSQGTYPLPEAQLDRFLLKVHVGYPTPDVERGILKSYLDGFDPSDLAALQLRCILDVDRLLAMQSVLRTLTVHDELLDYITRIVTRTRAHASVYVGASPRASVALLNTARAAAAAAGRSFIVPDDVKAYAHGVLRHRLILHPDAELENVSADDVIEGILRETPVPKSAA
jgi:MoxR-like ATPase